MTVPRRTHSLSIPIESPTRWSSAIEILKRRQLKQQRELDAVRELERQCPSPPLAADVPPPQPHPSSGE